MKFPAEQRGKQHFIGTTSLYINKPLYKQKEWQKNKTQPLSNFKILRNNNGPGKESFLYSNALTEDDTNTGETSLTVNENTVSLDE